ncbi:MAG: glycosyltransferase [Dehalococcoidia bacterium]
MAKSATLSAPARARGKTAAEEGGLVLPVDERVARLLPRDLLQERWFVPLRCSEDELVIGCDGPLDARTVELIREHVGAASQLEIREVRLTSQQVHASLASHFKAEDRHAIAHTLPPELSARRVLTYRHALILGGLGAALAYAVATSYVSTLIGLVTASLALYATGTAYKLYLLTLSLWAPRQVRVERADALPDDELPVYTVLIPLFREGQLLPRLLAAVERFDYPTDRLEVFFLLEEDDIETRAVADAIDFPEWAIPMVVPLGAPKGKPRALDYGLLYARGELLVIYDAEDVPDPGQLRAAATAFAQAGHEVACVQCSLAFYNGRQNLLTRLFAVEYATWFEFVLPALSHTSVPIPLGGTSNHFRVTDLRRIGGWDAYNVTEDADLGMRFARSGFRTITLESTTLEEANSRLWNWVRQRTRWNKGHMVTYLVHMRRPLRLWRALGTRGFLSWQLLMGGGLLTQLLNPVFWTLLVIWYATQWTAIRPLFPLPLLYLGNALLIASTFAYVTFGAFSCLRNRHYYAAPTAILLPAYWLLQSFAAYRALAQLVTMPHYWEKTEHNLATAASIRRSGLLDLALARPRAASRPPSLDLGPTRGAEAMTATVGPVTGDAS